MLTEDTPCNSMPLGTSSRPSYGPATNALNDMLKTTNNIQGNERNWKWSIGETKCEETVTSATSFPLIEWDEGSICANERLPIMTDYIEEVGPTKITRYCSITSYPYNKTRSRKECIATTSLIPSRKRRCYGLIRSMRCLAELNSLSLDHPVSNSDFDSISYRKLIGRRDNSLPPKGPRPLAAMRRMACEPSGSSCSILLQKLHL